MDDVQARHDEHLGHRTRLENELRSAHDTHGKERDQLKTVADSDKTEELIDWAELFGAN